MLLGTVATGSFSWGAEEEASTHIPYMPLFSQPLVFDLILLSGKSCHKNSIGSFVLCNEVSVHKFFFLLWEIKKRAFITSWQILMGQLIWSAMSGSGCVTYIYPSSGRPVRPWMASIVPWRSQRILICMQEALEMRILYLWQIRCT